LNWRELGVARDDNRGDTHASGVEPLGRFDDERTATLETELG